MIDYQKIDSLFGPPLNETPSMPQPQKVEGVNLVLFLGMGVLIAYFASLYIKYKIEQSQELHLRNLTNSMQ